MGAVASLLTVAGQTLAIYLFLVVGLASLGRRLTTQLTSLELIVLLILGSAVETAMVARNTSLPAGLVSAATLLLANALLTALLRRSSTLRRWIVRGPILLVHDGRIIRSHLSRAGLTDAEVLEAVRERGYASLDQIRYAYLETDGSVGVIPGERPHPRSADVIATHPSPAPAAESP